MAASVRAMDDLIVGHTGLGVPVAFLTAPLGTVDSAAYALTLARVASNTLVAPGFPRFLSASRVLKFASSFFSVTALAYLCTLALLAFIKSSFFVLESFSRSYLTTFAPTPNLLLVVRYFDWPVRF